MFLKTHFIHKSASLRSTAALATIAAGLALAACGGGGTTGSTVSGTAIDGYLEGATVCLDLNRNGACDATEPQTTTNSAGAYNFTIPDGYDNAGYEFLVDVPPTAVDSDNPGVLVGKSFVMRTPFYMRSVITPLSTVVSAYVTNGMGVEAAKAQAATDLGLPAGFDFAKDYVAASDVQAHNAAKVVARVLQTQPSTSAAAILAAVATNKTAIQDAAASSTPYTTSVLDTKVAAVVPEAPLVSATAPTATPVISIYSDAYTAVNGVDTNPNWGQATKVRELQVASGDKVLQLSGINYQGLTFDVQDVSAMNSLHVDVWSLAGGTVTLGVITSGAQTGGDPLQTDVAITLTAGWNAVNIPLSSYSKPDLKKVDQMVWAASGSPTIYVDNLYFWNDPSQVTTVATGTLPGILENFDGSATPTLGDYGQGGETTVAAGPTGGSGQAGKFVKKLGNPPWNGMFWTMSSPLTFNGASATVTTRVWVDTAATANELYVETAAGGSSQVTATSAGPWVANSWQTVTWSFTGLDPNAVYTVMGFAPNRATTLVADETYYVDDIVLTSVTP